MPENTLFTYRVAHESPALLEAGHPLWERCDTASIDRYCSGKYALNEKGYSWNNLTQVSSLWASSALFFFFECWFDVGSGRTLSPDSDCLEESLRANLSILQLKPEGSEDYFQFDVDPLGNWRSYHVIQPYVELDSKWNADLQVQTDITERERVWRAIFRIPYRPMMSAGKLTRMPVEGDAWRLNLHRVADSGAEREFLSWQPAYSQEPDFHRPSSFGNLIFLSRKRR